MRLTLSSLRPISLSRLSPLSSPKRTNYLHEQTRLYALKSSPPLPLEVSCAPLSGLGYGAAKAGLNYIIKSLTTLLAPYDIRANVIAPGFYLSELSGDAFKRLGIEGDGTREGSFPAGLVPAKQAGGEEDMAGMTLFLCSRAGAYINGSVILSDGGRVGVGNGTY